MNRRDFLRWTAGSAAILTARFRALGQSTRGFNLLIIQTDEHNFRTLGCYRRLLPREQALMWGDAVVETPNIDWIAEHGAVCTSFYATTPVCSPSRAAFMSGRYPHNTAVHTNNIPMNDDVITFSEVLRRQGYATGYAGKWHLDGTGKPQWAPQRKFGFEDNRYMFNRGHWKQLEDTPEGPQVKARRGDQPTYDVRGADAQSFTTDFLCDRTIEFITTHRDQAFCYMVSLPDPHGPDTVRPPYDTMFNDQEYVPPRTFNKPDEGLPSWGTKQGGFDDMAPYYGMIKCIDDNVGKILTCLRENGLIDNTIIVFTADHGDLRGEHHRQNKGVPYDGSARIPFVIYCPGTIPRGTAVREAMSCVDFKPTVLGLMSFGSAGPDEGRDCSSFLTGGIAPAGWTDVVFMRGTGLEPGWVAAVTRRYKLVYSTRDDPWLFDLEKDPDELTNFFTHSDYRDTVRTLSEQLRAYGHSRGDPRLANARIRADLKWAIEGTGAYVSNGSVSNPAPSGATRKKRAGRRDP